MLPGPDQVVACPHCKGLTRHTTLMSGNTFGASTWTDGKQIAPMLPTIPPLVRCGHCNVMYWLADAEPVGPILSLREPTEQDFYSAIEKGFASDPAQERMLRVLAWWSRNDTYRAETGRPARRPWRVSPEARSNIEALIKLLDEKDPNGRIMKAEALRELGEFDEAKRVLSGVHPERNAAAVSQIRALCDAKDARLRVLATAARDSMPPSVNWWTDV